jgi:hypothetical protein
MESSMLMVCIFTVLNDFSSLFSPFAYYFGLADLQCMTWNKACPLAMFNAMHCSEFLQVCEASAIHFCPGREA